MPNPSATLIAPPPAIDMKLSSPKSDAVADSPSGVAPADRKKNALNTRTLEDIANDPGLGSGVSWLVDDLIPLGALTVLYGIGKGGKTTLLTHLTASVLSGRTFLEREVSQGPVLWIDLEQHIALTAEKLLEAAPERRSDLHVYNGPPPEVAAIESRVKQTGSKLVVIDSLSRLLSLRDENDASLVTRGIAPILDLCRSTNAAVIAIHHDRKREGSAGRSLRGSSAFLAALDVAVSLKREGGSEDQTRHLEFVGRYYPSTRLSVKLGADGYELVSGEKPVGADDALVALGGDQLTLDEWAGRLNLKRNSLSARANALVAEGRVERMGKGYRSDPFRYRMPTNAVGASPLGDTSVDTNSASA